MSNRADQIEAFLLRKLAGNEDDIIVVQRRELADQLECAPSQISYVLATRFSEERGFIVESRRGLGGYIRIIRMQEMEEVDSESLLQSAGVSQWQLEWVLACCEENGILTRREHQLLKQVFSVFFLEGRTVKRPEETLKEIQKMIIAASS